LSERNLEHPVWEVYKLQRTARLSVKYYSKKLERIEQLNLAMQIVIAASLPTSAIAGFSYWTTDSGSEFWGYILAFASLLSFLQPFLKLTDKIKRYDSLITGYLVLDYDVQKLIGKIVNAQKYTTTHQKAFELALERKKHVGVKEQGISIDEKLREKCTEEVKLELPAENFFIPKD